MHKITKSQKIQFDLMKNASFNYFDGEKIVGLLKENPDFWDGVVMGRTSCLDGEIYSDLIHLRDIQEGFTNVDTVFITATKGRETDLERLVKKSFKADEVGWLDDDEANRRLGGGVKNKVLRVWWD
jgi:hypothetical protein